MTRGALPALALLLIASVAWMLIAGRGTEGDGTVVDRVLQHGPEQGTGEPAGAGTAIEREDILAADPAVPAPAPEYAEPSSAAEAMSVEVFDLATGAAAAGAEVYYVDLGAWSEDFADRAYAATDSETARGLAYGVRYRCAADGRVRVPPRTGRAILVARLDDRIGMYSFADLPAGGSESVRIALEPHLLVTALVLRADGAPAPDCRVALAALTRGGRWFTMRTSTTDGAGRAEFDHVQERGLGDGSGRVHLVVYEPLSEPVRVEIVAASWPNAPITLQLPATGALQVQLVDRGEPHVEEGVWLAAVCVEPGASPDPQRNWRVYGLGTGGARQSDPAGRVRFPYVSPGAPLDLHLNQTATHEARSARADAMARADTTVHTDFQVGELLAFLTARVVDPRGAPLPGLPVIAGLVDIQTRSTYGGSWVTTDLDGRLRIPVTERAAPQGRPRGLEVRERGIGDAVARYHVVPVPDLLQSGDNDIDEIVLGGRPLVGGTVVDPSGRPLGEVYIRLQAGTPEDFVRVADVQTGPDGRFLYDCAVPAGPLFLDLTPPEPFRPTRVDFARGRTDLLVTVPRDTRLDGTLLLPEGAGPHLVQITARAIGGDWTESASHPFSDGRFHIPEVPPGVDVQLTVKPWAGREPVFQGTYRLNQGEQAVPPELNPLDLRDLLHLHRLEVLHEDGSVPPACSVEFDYADGTRGSASAPRSNLLQLLTPDDELELLVKAPGCVPAHTTLRGSGVVHLAPGSPITVAVEMPTLPDGYQLVLELAGTLDVGRGHPAQLHETVVCAAPGTQQIRLPARVEYRLSASLQRLDRRGPPRPLELPASARNFDAGAAGASTYRLVLADDAFDGIGD